jgi:DMSO/TMAO reductase YedYZ molybdopterin-dependent catalytic subunit
LGSLCAAMAFAQATQPAKQPSAAPATLTISGDVPSQLTLKAEDLAKMPRETVSIPDQDGTKIQYEGVPLREILKRAGAPVEKELRGKALASYILAKAHDGYQVVFTLAEVAPEFANEPILVADKRDGKPLFGYQGPFRLVCPNDKAGARSVRMLETLEIVQLQK